MMNTPTKSIISNSSNDDDSGDSEALKKHTTSTATTTKRQDMLYYCDSSDEDNEIPSYSQQNILNNISKLSQSKLEFLIPSYILTEVGQSIIEQACVRSKYKDLKCKLAQKSLLKETAAKNSGALDSSTLGKNVGLYLAYGDKTSAESINQVAKLLEVSTNIAKQVASTKNEILSNEKHITKDNNYVNNLCTEWVKKLFGVMSRNNDSVNLFKDCVLSNITSPNTMLLTLFQESNVYSKNKQKQEIVRKKLSEKTIQSFKEEIVRDVNTAFIKKELRTIENDNNPNYNPIILTYQDIYDLRDVFSKKGTIIKHKFLLFCFGIIGDAEKVVMYQNRIFIDYVSEKNRDLVEDLMAYRQIEMPIFAINEDYFVNFRLDHRITRGKLKQCLMTKEKQIADSSKVLQGTTVSVIEKITFESSGTKTDYKVLPSVKDGSYSAISEKLTDFKVSGADLKEALYSIIRGQGLNNIESCVLKLFLYRVADLLFNCEGERNISAFLSNIMFLELVAKDTYKISELPDILPMAMQGAIQVSRYSLDLLGGTYCGSKNGYLTKRQYFDFKKTAAYKKVINEGEYYEQEITQDNLKEMLTHYEFALKNARLFHTWNKQQKFTDLDNHIKLLQNINMIYNYGNTHFNGIKIDSVLNRNRLCIKELEKLNKCHSQLNNINKLLETQAQSDQNTDGDTHKIKIQKKSDAQPKENATRELLKLVLITIEDEISQINFDVEPNFSKGLYDLVKYWYHIDLSYLVTEDAISVAGCASPQNKDDMEVVTDSD